MRESFQYVSRLVNAIGFEYSEQLAWNYLEQLGISIGYHLSMQA